MGNVPTLLEVLKKRKKVVHFFKGMYRRWGADVAQEIFRLLAWNRKKREEMAFFKEKVVLKI